MKSLSTKQRISIPEDVKQNCVELLEEGKSPFEIYETYYKGKSNASYDTFSRCLRNWKKGNKSSKHAPICENINASNQSAEYKSDGSATFEGIISLMEGEPITPEIIMQAHNLEKSKWDVMAYKTNFWQAQAKGGRKMLLYQSKISVKPKEIPEITLDEIDRYFESKDYSKGKLPIECVNYDEAAEILEIDLADPHVGLLSWRKESGSDYDLKIAKQRFFWCISDIVRRCEGMKLKKIVLVGLGDVLHVDNNEQKTTNGTFQQTDGRLEKITECAEDMIIDGITILGRLAPVEYIHLCGNHDRLTGYMLARSVKNAFKYDKNVTFDISPDPIKNKVFGISLVVFHHGDLPRKNTGDLPINFAREHISETKFTEVHCGHYHTEETKVIGGVRVRYLPTIAASSYWEHQQGYNSDKAVVCYLWNEKAGLRSTWYTMI